MTGTALSTPGAPARAALPAWQRALIFAAAYFLVAEFGRYLSVRDSPYISFWLPAGLYVAVLLLNESRSWPWLVLGAFAGNLVFDLLHGTSFIVALLFSTTNALQSVGSAWLVRRYVAERPRLTTLREFFGFMGIAAVLGSMIGATLGTATLLAFDLGDSFMPAWKVWWGSNAMAILLVSPLLLAFREFAGRARRAPPARLAEAVALVALSIALTWHLLFMDQGTMTPDKGRMVLPLLWAALRFGPLGASAANLLLAFPVAFFTTQLFSGLSPAHITSGDYVFVMQNSLAVAALIGLVPAIALEERRRAEAETAELAAIVQSSEDAIVSMTPEGLVLTWNKGAERLFGHTAAQAVGQPISLVYLPGEEFEYRRNLEAIRQGERHYEAQRARRDGSTVAVSVTAFPMLDPAGGIAGIGAIYRDITRRKQAQEELQRSLSRQRELSRRLIEAEETERRNINRELHDRIGQNLATLNLNVGMIRSQLPGEVLQAVAPRMNDTQKLLADTMGHVRDLMAELHPVALDDYGLVAALRTHAAEFSRRFAIAVSVSGSDPAPRLPLTVETALFRIAQEALNNVTKHAYATNVEIRVEAEKGSLVLSITDDGQGFDRKQLGDARSWGMTTMRERAQAVGAVLAVDSAPGFGTRVEVRVSRSVA